MGFEKPKSSAARVAKRRAVLRAQGLRPRTFWLPDTRTAEYREQAARNCRRMWELVAEDEALLAFADTMAAESLASLPLPWSDDE